MANTTSPVALDETLKVTNQKLDALKTAIENGGGTGGGGSTSDCYKTTDETVTEVADTDYMPLSTASGKKKTLLSTLEEKFWNYVSTKLSTVATSGSYDDLTNKPTIPSAYTLPTATSSILGGIKLGSGLKAIDGQGLVTTAFPTTMSTVNKFNLLRTFTLEKDLVSSNTIYFSLNDFKTAFGLSSDYNDFTKIVIKGGSLIYEGSGYSMSFNYIPYANIKKTSINGTDALGIDVICFNNWGGEYTVTKVSFNGIIFP